MDKSYWKTWSILFKYKGHLVMLLLGAFLSAASFGGGIGSALPMFYLLFDQKKSLPTLILEFADKHPHIVVREHAEWFANHMPQDPFRAFLMILSFMMVLAFVGNFGRYLHELNAIIVAAKATLEWRARCFRHLIRLPTVSMFSMGASDPIERITSDTRQMSDGYNAVIGRTFNELLKTAVGLAIALVVNPYLTACALVFAGVILVLFRKLGKRITRAANAAMGQRSRMIGSLSESLGGLSVVKTHNAEGYERRRFWRINRKLFFQETRARRAKALSGPLIETVASVAFAGMGTVVAWFILRRNVPMGQFLTVLWALGGASQSLRPLSSITTTLFESAAATRRVLEVLDMPVEPIGLDDRQHLPTLTRHHGSVVFENVSFTYPDKEIPAVDRVHLEVKFGQTVAVVGSNGSGKTTLLSLLPRLLQPASGRVLIDGQDLNTVNLRSLREQMAVVTQQSILFEGTVFDNIAYARRHESADRVYAAAQAAYAHDFIQELPKGYKTKLGEDGTGLSGGQRQRLCIARAILRDPAILILDEATSQIDADSEAKISRALAQFRHGRTTFIIAHRLSTVVDADIIVVMDRGRIIDQGTHRELLQRCAIYRLLNQTQLLADDSTDTPPAAGIA